MDWGVIVGVTKLVDQFRFILESSTFVHKIGCKNEPLHHLLVEQLSGLMSSTRAASKALSFTTHGHFMVPNCTHGHVMVPAWLVSQDSQTK